MWDAKKIHPYFEAKTQQFYRGLSQHAEEELKMGVVWNLQITAFFPRVD